jgi:hypothetical protein
MFTMIVKDWEQVFPMLKHWVFFDAANQMIPGSARAGSTA